MLELDTPSTHFVAKERERLQKRAIEAYYHQGNTGGRASISAKTVNNDSIKKLYFPIRHQATESFY